MPKINPRLIKSIQGIGNNHTYPFIQIRISDVSERTNVRNGDDKCVLSERSPDTKRRIINAIKILEEPWK
jgi:hypothetical protein